MNGTDSLLLKRWMEGRDAEAFREIVTRHAGMVYATARRILASPMDAEEVAQECFLKLAEAQRPPRRSLAGWLHTVATHGAISRVRSDARRREREIRYASRTAEGAERAWEDMLGFVDEAIAALPEKLREPVVAHFLEGETHNAIAAQMGISQSGVTRRIQRGIEQIRKTLSRRGVDISASILTAVLLRNAAEAAPVSLVTNLGKVALAGSPSAAAAIPALGASWLFGKTLLGAILSPTGLAAGALTSILAAGAILLLHPSAPTTGPDLEEPRTELETPAPEIAAPPVDREAQPASASISTPPPAAEQTGTVIRGRVLAGPDNTPLPHFAVGRVVSEEKRVVLMDSRQYADGYFEYPVEEGQGVTLAAYAENYTFGRVYCAVPEDLAGEEVEIVLQPAGAVSGTVLDARTKKPVAGAVVDVGPEKPGLDSVEMAGFISSLTSTKSDSGGRFALAHVKEGQRHVVAWHTKYPRTAHPVEVTAGKETSGVRILVVQGAGTVRGYAYLDGRPVSGAMIEYWKGPTYQQVTTGPDGSYEFAKLPPQTTCSTPG